MKDKIIYICPNCNKRHELTDNIKNISITCLCGKDTRLTPLITNNQKFHKPDKVECLECNRIYSINKFRDKTEIICSCGNMLKLPFDEIYKKTYGRRRNDSAQKQLEIKLYGLIDTCKLIHLVRDLDKLLILVVRVTTEMLNAEGCTVILKDNELNELVFQTVSGVKSSILTSFRLEENEGIAGYCVKSKKSIVVNDAKNDERFSKRADFVSGFSTRSILCLPLIVEKICIGALEIVNKKTAEGFNEEDLFLGEAVASQIAVAIHNVQLTESALKAEKLASIGQAIAGISHCVKNILNGIQGGLYVFMDDLKKKYKEIPEQGYKMAEKNMNIMNELMVNLIQYSKDREPEYKNTDLNELVKSVIELMNNKAIELKIKINFKPGSNLNNVKIDPTGIYRCVLNLILNAFDACEEKNGCIDIKTYLENSTWIIIEIHDNGIGMDEETSKQIFQPFYSKKGSKGTGLGLSITQKITQEHKGKITVDSTEGKGSTFKIYLPYLK